MRCVVMIFTAFVGSSKWTWRGVEFLSPYFWICQLSTHAAISQQCKNGMSLCKDCKELHGVDQKSKCPWHAQLTLTNVDGGVYALPESTVANLSSCHGTSTILIQNVMKNVNTPSIGKLILLELTAMNMEVVMMMCFHKISQCQSGFDQTIRQINLCKILTRLASLCERCRVFFTFLMHTTMFKFTTTSLFFFLYFMSLIFFVNPVQSICLVK